MDQEIISNYSAKKIKEKRFFQKPRKAKGFVGKRRSKVCPDVVRTTGLHIHGLYLPSTTVFFTADAFSGSSPSFHDKTKDTQWMSFVLVRTTGLEPARGYR